MKLHEREAMIEMLEILDHQLKSVKQGLDELNGTLYELCDNNEPNEGDLNRIEQGQLDALHQFYILLPTWDDIESTRAIAKALADNLNAPLVTSKVMQDIVTDELKKLGKKVDGGE